MTPDLLRAATGCSTDNAALYAPHLAEGCALYQINTPARLAAFLAQIGHESASLSRVEESLNYTPAALMATFGERRIALAEAQALGRIDGRKADQRLIANLVYGREWGRINLGNTEPEDGWKFRGQGLIQSTGRYNARRLTQRLQSRLGLEVPDFEAHPELLQEPRWAALSACDYWDRTGCNAYADEGDFEGLTKRINGGMHGADDRRRRWEMAKQAIEAQPTAVPAFDESIRPVREPAPMGGELPPESAKVRYSPSEWDLNNPPPPAPEKKPMPIAPIIAALLPSIVEAIPKLGRVFGSGSEVAERNIKAAELVVETVKTATGAVNAQDAVERLRASPEAVAVATTAIDAIWYDLTEAGSGGLEGARKADAAQRQAGDLLHSASFWIALTLLPLVYLLVLSLIGLIGTANWSDDVRAGLSGSLISAVIGGLVGYYYGQTTSRNRAPGP